jgi:hypothetical protein
MQELRFVAVSEDGSYAVLAIPGRSGRFMLPIDERLRAVAQGQTSRLAQYEIEVESPLRPKEIQARIRAGETAEEIADAAGIPVERVRWFEGPVLAERGYIADQAQAASVRRAGDSSGPGPRLGDIVTARLSAAGSDPADGQWDSRKRGDGSWQVSLTFPSGGRLHVAEWVFDPRRRHVMPDDDNAARLSLPESELPAEPVPMPGEATVTPIASRLGAAAGMGGGGMGGGGFGGGPAVSSRFRPDRSVIPDRSLGADRSLVERPVPPAVPAPDRPGYQSRPASYNFVEFPESAPYPVPEPEPAAYRDPAPDLATPGRPAPAAQAPATSAPDTSATAAPPAPAHQGPALDDSERTRLTPPRPVVFEEPEPTLLARQLELGPATPPAPPTQPSAASAPAPVAQAPATAPAASAPAHDPASPVPPRSADQRPATPASATASASPELATLAPEPATTPVPAPAAVAAAEPVATAAPAAVEPAASAASEPEAEVPAPAEPPVTEDQENRPRQGARKNPKARRSSVPSWDEIMLGSSRPRD